MKKYLKYLTYLIPLMALSILVLGPDHRADLYIRIYFDENDRMVQGESLTLSYTTDTQDKFSPEQSVAAEIDHVQSRVEFGLSSLLENDLTGLRLDFPGMEQLICIKSITVSSGGVIRRQYNPCDFFSEENVADTDGIDSITPVYVGQRAYIATGSDSPRIVLSDALCSQITKCYSHFGLTKAAVYLFLLGCFLFSRKKIFTESAR